MYRLRYLGRVVAAVALTLLAPVAQAQTNVGGIVFNDNAFADQLTASVGSWTFGGGASSLEDALVGSTASDFAFCFGTTCSATLEFTDNLAVNLPGPDLAIFELGSAELFSVLIGGITNSYTAVATGVNAGGFPLLVAQINLDDFGILPGGTVSLLTLFPAPTGADPADFTVIGAINSVDVSAVPEPATLLLLAPALAGIGLVARRRRG